MFFEEKGGLTETKVEVLSHFHFGEKDQGKKEISELQM